MIRENSNEIWQTDFCSWCDNEIKVDDGNCCVIKNYKGGFGHDIYLGFHPKCYIDHELQILPLMGWLDGDRDYAEHLNQSVQRCADTMRDLADHQS